MQRDDISMDEAKEIVDEMTARILEDGDDPEDVLYDHGLEPDYVDDLLIACI